MFKIESISKSIDPTTFEPVLNASISLTMTMAVYEDRSLDEKEYVQILGQELLNQLKGAIPDSVGTVGILDTFEEWMDYLKFKEKLSTETFSNFDEERAKQLSRCVDGYMQAPTAVYNDQAIEVKSRKADKLQDIIDWFEKRTKKVFLYNLLYFKPEEYRVAIDPLTFEPKTFDEPRISPEYYLVRYAAV